jgi:basic membrane protein A
MSDPTSRTHVSRRKLLAAASSAGLASIAGCLGGDDGGSSAEVSAAWIYFAEADDQGWTSSHDTGRQETVEEFGDELRSDFVESVDSSNVEQTASQYAQDDYDVVFALSAGFTDPMAAASEQHPDTAFEVASGIDTGENYGSFYEKLYHARYLVGYAAGMVTENDNIGYIAANPVSTVYQEINGFASGVQDANEDATVYVRWTNAWYDPATEGENAQTLIDDEDVDVMAQHQDSPSALETAADNDIWASGYAESAADFAGDNYLMTPVFNWEQAYIPIIEDAQAGEWEAGYTFPGIADGAVEVSDPGPEVPQEVIDEVTSIQEEMTGGDADDVVWSGTPYEDWTEEEILFESDTLGVDNIEGQEL